MSWFRATGDKQAGSTKTSSQLAENKRTIRTISIVGITFLCLALVGLTLPSKRTVGALSVRTPAQSTARANAAQAVTSAQRANRNNAPTNQPAKTLPSGKIMPTPPFLPTMSPVVSQLPVQTPNPRPTALTRSEAIAVVGANGVDLAAKPGGAPVRKLAIDTVLTALGRSTDGVWIYVQASDNSSGWVPAAKIVTFDMQGLPVINSEVIAAATPIAISPAIVPTDTRKMVLVPTPTLPAPAKSGTSLQPTPIPDGRPTARVTLTGAHLNVRSGPGTNYPIVASTQVSDVFTVQARNDAATWVKIVLPTVAGGFGWVKVDFVALNVPAATLPVSTDASSAPVAAAFSPATATLTSGVSIKTVPSH